MQKPPTSPGNEKRASRAVSANRPELTDADKALLEAESDWERMGEAAKRLLSEKSTQPSAATAPTRKPRL